MSILSTAVSPAAAAAAAAAAVAVVEVYQQRFLPATATTAKRMREIRMILHTTQATDGLWVSPAHPELRLPHDHAHAR